MSPVSVLSSPLSAYSISAAVLCAVGILDVKVAVPVKMPLGKPASVLFRDLRSFHLPFKPSKMAAVTPKPPANELTASDNSWLPTRHTQA